jgi:general secretion pathway protein K
LERLQPEIETFRPDYRLTLLHREEGVVLIAVLWICALVMWFTLQIGALTRIQGEEQVHLFRRAQAHYLAIGGCNEALARMGQLPPTGLERGPDLSWQPDGTPHLLKYETGEAMVSVELETSKVNVNIASPDQLMKVLLAAGVDEDEVERLADVIADFIDPDDLPRLHGMEAKAYKRLGLDYGPFNGPLIRLEQMLLIPGITEPLFYGYLRKGGEREDAASEVMNPVLLNKNSLFALLSVYGTGVALPQTEAGSELEAKVITWQNGGIYRILSTAMAYHGPPAVTICLIVRFTPQSKTGYEVLSRKLL